MMFPIVENVCTSSDIVLIVSRGLQLPYRKKTKVCVCVFYITCQNQIVKKIRDTKVWALTNTDKETSYTNIHWCNLLYSAFMFNSEKYLSSFHPDRWQKVQMQDLTSNKQFQLQMNF